MDERIRLVLQCTERDATLLCENQKFGMRENFEATREAAVGKRHAE